MRVGRRNINTNRSFDPSMRLRAGLAQDRPFDIAQDRGAATYKDER
jgi:hypothetical protein